MMVNAPVRPAVPPSTRVPSFPPPAMQQQPRPNAPQQPPQTAPLAYPPQHQQPWPNAPPPQPQPPPLGQQRPMTAPVAFQSPRGSFGAPPNMQQHGAYHASSPFSPAPPPVYTPDAPPVMMAPPPRVVVSHAPPPAPLSSARDMLPSHAGERLSVGALVYMAAPLFFATALVAFLALR